jgi:hypothetical protein
MWWSLGGLALLLVLVVGGAAWLLVPTLRTFRGPAFEPISTDDASVFQAQQGGMIGGGA